MSEETPKIHDVTPELLANDPLYQTINAKDLGPEIIGEELHARLNAAEEPSTPVSAFTEGRAFDTSDTASAEEAAGFDLQANSKLEETPPDRPSETEIAPLPEPSYLAPTCQRMHVPNCACTGDARGPR